MVLGARGSVARSFSREPGDRSPLRRSFFPQETTEGTARAGPADVTAAQAALGGTAPLAATANRLSACNVTDAHRNQSYSRSHHIGPASYVSWSRNLSIVRMSRLFPAGEMHR